MRLTGTRVAGATVAVALALPALVSCTSDKPGHSSSESCIAAPATPTMKIALNTIHANVFNAGGKNGEAASIASQLTWRGIHIISTGNDPKGGQPPKHAEIRYGPNGKQIALTLAQQIKDATLEQDDRTNPSVDLVIGTDFSLVPVPPPKPSRVKVNVLNAFVIPGSASELASTLRKRGFQVVKTGNTKQFFPDSAAVIRYGLRGEPAARRLALQFKHPKLEKIHRSSATVDVIIGSKWKDHVIVPVAQATPTPVKSTKAKTSSCATTPAKKAAAATSS